MGVSESSVAWLFPFEKWFQNFKILTLRPILAHFRCKQQGAVSRGRTMSRFRPPAWSAATADLAQKPPAWSAPRSRPTAFARNQPLSRSKPAAWSATLRGPGTRSSGIPLLFPYYNHNQSTDPVQSNRTASPEDSSPGPATTIIRCRRLPVPNSFDPDRQSMFLAILTRRPSPR